MSSYPTNRAGHHFAHRFCRLLTKSAAAQDLGPEVCWLLTVIAHQEDAKRYRSAVTFWNEQLMPLCGFGSRKRLHTARQRAIDAGWLAYLPGGKGFPGRYWVTFPAGLTFGDESDLSVRNGTQTARTNARQRVAMRNGNSAPSYPSPIPNPVSAKDPPKLIELVDGWNSLAEQFALPRCKISSGLKKKWNAAQRDREKREALADVPKLLQAVKNSTFIHGKSNWTLQSLFNANKCGESKLLQTLRGAYVDDSRKPKSGSRANQLDHGIKAGKRW